MEWEKLAAKLGIDTEGMTPGEIQAAVTKKLDAIERAAGDPPKGKDVSSTLDESDPLFAEFQKLNASIAKLAQDDTKGAGEAKEEAARMWERLKALESKIGKKIRFSPYETGPTYKLRNLSELSYQEIIETPTDLDIVRELKEAHEEVAFTHAVLSTQKPEMYDRANGYKKLKSFARWDRIASELKRSLKDAGDPLAAGTSGFGAEWVPTTFTSELLDTLYRQELKVVPLFRQVNMPHSPYTFPVQTTKAEAKVEAETTATPTTVAALLGADPTNPATAGMTMTAVKYSVRLNCSGEMEEESIVPAIPFMRAELAKALAEGEENGVINGESGTTQNGTAGDFDITSPAIGTAWLGLRFHALDCSAGHSGGGDALVRADLDTMAKAAGKWANAKDAFFYMNFGSWWDLLKESDTPVIDASKLGAVGPLLTGQFGVYMGIPIILSEYVRQVLTANGYNEDGGANNLASAGLCNRTRAFWGVRRAATIEGVRMALIDLQYLVARKRSAFTWVEAVGASVDYNRLVYNITP